MILPHRVGELCAAQVIGIPQRSLNVNAALPQLVEFLGLQRATALNLTKRTGNALKITTGCASNITEALSGINKLGRVDVVSLEQLCCLNQL